MESVGEVDGPSSGVSVKFHVDGVVGVVVDGDDGADEVKRCNGKSKQNFPPTHPSSVDRS